MNLDPRQFLVWALTVSGVTREGKPLSCPARALILACIDGYSNVAIGREMEITADRAGHYVRESIQKLAAQEWEPFEVEMFHDMARKATEGETIHEHFRVLLEAIRNSQDATPRTVEYDVNGRAIGGRSPLVDVDTAIVACEGIRTLPAKLPKLCDTSRFLAV